MEPVERVEKDHLLPISILVAGILIAGSIMYLVHSGTRMPSGTTPPPPPDGGGQATAPAVQERDVILGDPNAPVTLIEYGDYQCPFCVQFYVETEIRLREEYVKTNKVRMVFRNFAFLGPESIEAAEAAECAKDQGKFWAYHDAIYVAEYQDGAEHNGNLNRALFLKIASDLEMDIAAFTSCYDSNKYASQISGDYDAAIAAGVESTPTVFINEVKLLGALPYIEFKEVIDTLLSTD